jgi:hypothetical protein
MCARNGRSGPSVLAELTGVDRTTVWAWFRSVDRNGTGGLIPTNKQKLLYLSARRRGINLTAEQIIGVDDAFFDDQEKLNGRRKKGTVA